MDEIKLELKNKSWNNLFKCIRDSEIKAEGNFWASVQYLEDQLDDFVKFNTIRNFFCRCKSTVVLNRHGNNFYICPNCSTLWKDNGTFDFELIEDNLK